MSVRKNTLIIALFLGLLSCSGTGTNNKQTDTDSIAKQESEKPAKKQQTESGAYINAFKVETSGYTFDVYQLVGGKPGFTVTKPETADKNILLSIAASFTGKDLTSIMGPHIVDGQKLTGYGKPNGYCVILGNKMRIKSSSDSLKYYTDLAIEQKGDLFRQELLVLNGEAVPCNLFKVAVPLRAIAIYKGIPSVIESEGAITISDFTSALIAMGVSDALYADMGGWSYGWYRDKEGKATHLGILSSNTGNQTNWFIFEK